MSSSSLSRRPHPSQFDQGSPLLFETLEDRQIPGSVLGMAAFAGAVDLWPSSRDGMDSGPFEARSVFRLDFDAVRGGLYGDVGEWTPRRSIDGQQSNIAQEAFTHLDAEPEADPTPAIRPVEFAEPPVGTIDALRPEALFLGSVFDATFGRDASVDQEQVQSGFIPFGGGGRAASGDSGSAPPADSHVSGSIETGASASSGSSTSSGNAGASVSHGAPDWMKNAKFGDSWFGGLAMAAAVSGGQTVYVLDWNDGLVLDPSAMEFEKSNTYVDLRAQVKGKVSSISWDLSNASWAAGVTGQSTYNLKFHWASGAFAPGQNDVQQQIVLTVNMSGGGTVTQTYTFRVMSGPSSLSGSASVSRSEVTSPDAIAASQSYIDGDYHSIGAAAGNLVVDHGLPGYGPRSANLGVAYDSEAASPHPVFLDRYQIDPSTGVPSTVSAQLTLNGTTYQTYYYDTSSLMPGDILQIALQGDASALATGRYDWSISVTANYSGGGVTTTNSGKVDVVNRSGGAVGQGWRIDGLDQLYSVSGGMLLDDGDHSVFFSSSGGSYYAQAGDFSTLVANSGGTYTRTLKDGTKYNFTSSGMLSTVVDLNGNTVTYAYSGGNLSTITDSNGLVTTYGYSGGKLVSITDPASRVTTLTYTGSKLTGITDPDSAAWGYGYDGSGRMTSLSDPRSKTTTFTYTGGRVSGFTRPDSTSVTVSPHQLDGWVASGSGTIGSPAAAVLAVQSATGYTDGRGFGWDTRFDWYGLGVGTETTDPLLHWNVAHYDANGLATQVTDALNRNEVYTYDAKGNVLTDTHPDYYVLTWTYNAFSEVTQYKDEDNKTWNYTYDASGNLLTATDPLSDVTTYTYTGDGKVATVTDAASRLTTYTYDGYDRLTQVSQPAVGGVHPLTGYTYDAAGHVLTVTDALSHVTTFTYDAMGRLLTKKLPDGTPLNSSDNPVWTWAYDSGGNLTSQTDPLGHATTYAYDNRNRLTSTTDALSHTTSFAYDNEGNLTSTTDPLSRTTTFTYDNAGRRISTTDALSHTTTYTVDAMGQVTAVTDALSHATTYTYTNRGQLATVTDATGVVTSYAYDSRGRLTAEQNSGGLNYPGGAGAGYAYDDLGRELSLTDSDGVVVEEYTYDSVGNVATSAKNGVTTTYAYDALNRVTSVTDALTHVVATYTYDLAGNLLTSTDALSRTTTYSYDEQNRLKTQTDPLSHVTTFGYDLAGRTTSVTDASSNVTSYTYDNANRLTVETDPRGKTTTYAYDAANELTQVTDRDGRVKQYTYNNAGLETAEKWLNASGATIRTESYTYDAANRLTQATDPDSTYYYTYDAANRLLTVDNSGTASAPHVVLTYTYNANGQVLSVTDNSSGSVAYTYSTAGRMTGITMTVSGKSSKPVVEFSYDSHGLLSQILRKNYVMGGGGGGLGGPGGGGGVGGGSSYANVKTLFTYDADGRVTYIDHQTDSGGFSFSTIASYGYTWDNASQLTQEVSNDGTVNYTYDSGSQLATASGWRSETYSFDSTGNRNSSGYSTSTGNRTTTDGVFNYDYDDEGNLTKKTRISTGEYVEYTWDYRNRLTQVVDKNASGAVQWTSTYTYDVFNRRIGRNDGGTTQWTAYDGENAWSDSSGSTLKTRYISGREMDEIYGRLNMAADTFDWYLKDMLGSVRDVASQSGAVIDHIAYDSFGKILSESAPSAGDRFKFTGREFDSQTGLYYYRARYYDPAQGKFIGQDPMKFGGGDQNLYRYGANSPTTGIDPTGMKWVPGSTGWEWVPGPGETPYPSYPPPPPAIYPNGVVPFVSRLPPEGSEPAGGTGTYIPFSQREGVASGSPPGAAQKQPPGAAQGQPMIVTPPPGAPVVVLPPGVPVPPKLPPGTVIVVAPPGTPVIVMPPPERKPPKEKELGEPYPIFPKPGTQHGSPLAPNIPVQNDPPVGGRSGGYMGLGMQHLGEIRRERLGSGS